MAPDFFNRSVVGAMLLLAAVGVVDGVIDDDLDGAAVFAMVAFLGVVLLARMSWGRPGIPVRADLARWMQERAIEGDETIGQIADRALGAYRADLLRAGEQD